VVLERSFLPLLTLRRFAKSGHVSRLLSRSGSGLPELFFSPVISFRSGSHSEKRHHRGWTSTTQTTLTTICCNRNQAPRNDNIWARTLAPHAAAERG
jgi:hypothetical protein